MKSLYRVFWWIMYTAGAVVVQQAVPGVDALMPGFLLALQEKRPRQILVLFIAFTLIQEGAGSLNFGTAVLGYGGAVLFFRMSHGFFVEDNIVFVVMLSACLGLYHGLLTWLMCAVQTVPVDFEQLVRESVIQTLIIPLIWGLAYFVRPKSTAAAAPRT
ncbi:MAG: hypothetical protein LBQ51_01995 [Desulfovibrio sp.]|jgi:hypothetical protein|nr:hypothetical protein [Desulfovibrio sp.]